MKIILENSVKTKRTDTFPIYCMPTIIGGLLMEEIKEYQKKVLILGDGAVGKTSLIRRFVVDKFDDKYILTIGSKVTAKALKIEMHGASIYLKLQIWDVLGQKGYKRLYSSTFRGSKGVLLVADITRKETLQSLENYWIPTIQKIIGNIPFVILANKSDLGKATKFKDKELREFAGKYKAPSYITSAKTGENVDLAFKILGKKMIKSKATDISPEPNKIIPEVDNGGFAEIIDRIIDDFCKEYNRPLDAMPILRKQFELAKLDLKKPTQKALKETIERLADIEMGFKDWEIVKANRKKRLKWIKDYREE
jgi:small GTP-binding protein